MASKKTVFQQFVEANQGLLDCYNKVKIEDYKKMPDAGKEALCSSQKDKIREILNSNQMVMSNLIKERIEILNRLNSEWSEAGSPRQ